MFTKIILCMVHLRRLELRTHRLKVDCSPSELRRHIKSKVRFELTTAKLDARPSPAELLRHKLLQQLLLNPAVYHSLDQGSLQ